MRCKDLQLEKSYVYHTRYQSENVVYKGKKDGYYCFENWRSYYTLTSKMVYRNMYDPI